LTLIFQASRCAFMTANEVLVSPGEGSNAIVTHGILLRPGIRVRASSSDLGWRGIAASVQSELPFSGSYDAVSDHLVVLHVGRPARVAGRIFSIATALALHHQLGDQNQFIHFFKNVAMAGGLLQVVAFGAGRLSIDARRS
jgi:hypothetical protein